MLFARSRLFAAPKIHHDDDDHQSKLFLVRAKDDTDNRAYYFMLVEKERIAALKSALSGKTPCDLKEYGEIVASGYGEQVPESLKIRMRVEHAWSN